jgi:hypothetical protein
MPDLDEFKYAPAADVELADKLIRLKQENKLWEVVELCFDHWAKKNPEEWKSYIVEVQNIRDTRKTTKGIRGVSKSPEGSYVEYTLDIPEDVIYMLRVLYTPDELPMDRQFFRKLGRRFPKFRVSGK